MTSVKESIQADTNLDVESALKEKDELKYLRKRNLFLKLYISFILLINFATFVSSQFDSIGDIFLLAGMLNIAISGMSIYYYYIGMGIKQGFAEFSAPGGMLQNMGAIENKTSWNTPADQPRFTVYNPSVTIYLFTIPMFIGMILIIFGFFFV